MSIRETLSSLGQINIRKPFAQAEFQEVAGAFQTMSDAHHTLNDTVADDVRGPSFYRFEDRVGTTLGENEGRPGSSPRNFYSDSCRKEGYQEYGHVHELSLSEIERDNVSGEKHYQHLSFFDLGGGRVKIMQSLNGEDREGYMNLATGTITELLT